MECETCGGSGEVPDPQSKAKRPKKITCPACKGDGEQLGPFGTHLMYIPPDPEFYGPADMDDD